MAEKKSLATQILGIRLGIKTTQSQAEFDQVAELLKTRIDAIQSAAASGDSLKIALLAALDISRELVDARKQLEELRDMTAERSLALVERLEAETASEGDVDLAEGKSGKSISV